MRRQLLAFVSAATALLTAPSSSVEAAANIDNGFIQDGDTTYCQGVRGASGNPLEFLELEAHNVGRCPIDVLISVTASTVGLLTPLEVQWAASVRSNVVNNIFPRAVDPATKKPQNVIASLLRACVVGTNCAPSGVVIPQVLGAAESETGAFDAQGRKALRPFRFQFPNAGDYVIVGVVTLPGDAALNVSATQFLAFQRIKVVDGVGPATVKPPSVGGNTTKEVAGEGKTDNLNFGDSIIKSKNESATVNPSSGSKSSGVVAEFTGSQSSDTGPSGNGLNMTMILMAGVVALLIVVAIIMFVIARKKKRAALKGMDRGKPLNPDSQAGIFRLSNASDMMSLSMGSAEKYAATNRSNSTAYTGSHKSLAPPRYTTQSQASSSSTDSGPFTTRRKQSTNSSNYPSFENAALAASGKEFKPQQHNRRSSASSASSTFSDLHDSSEKLPVVRASAATSYGGYDDYSRQSSRLFSEASVAMPRDVSEYSTTFDERGSEYEGSLGSRRSTELGPLSECSTLV